MSNAVTLQDLLKLPSEKARIDHLMRELNPAQRLAAMTLDGASIAIAGAGAGKTKTLIHLTAHHLIKGTPATSLMLVTFTNKGADEIKTRLEAMVGEDAQYITAGTFHSIIYHNILKPNANHPFLEGIGLDMNECTIFDDSESDALFSEAIKLLDSDSQEYIAEDGMEKTIKMEMSAARAKGLNADSYARERIGYGDPKEIQYRLTVDVWNKYSGLCRAANGIDFDDIMVVALQLMKADPNIGKELSQRFRYLMLDEYQDTNPVQMKIMDDIAKHHGNIFAVGDEKQSIYGFRGADIGVILGFKHRYPDALVIDMDTNYRSTRNILEAANCIARHMSQKLTEGQLKVGKPFMGDGHKVGIVEFASDLEEAKVLAQAIRRDIAKGVPGKDIAVLYRSRSVKACIEQELVRNGIDYTVVGDVSFFQRQEVRNAIAFLRMTFRPWDSMATLRVLKHTSFGVSDASAKKAMSKGQTAQAYLNELAGKTRGKNEPTAVASKVAPLIGAMGAIRKLVAYGEDSDYIRKGIESLWENYMISNIKKAAEKDNAPLDEAVENRMQNVSFLLDRFFDEMKAGRKPEDILDELSLLGEAKNQTEREQEHMIKLMTLHASKGMEFRHVYLPGMDEDTTPGKTEEYDELEEERRAVYVGVTRAQEKLGISYARKKRKFGSIMETRISPFIKELSQGTNNPVFKYKATQAPTPGR